MWTCPKCDKIFARAHQSHRCIKLPPEALFHGKAPELWLLFEHLVSELQKIGSCRVTTSDKSISLYAANHKVFLVVQPKKKWMDIYFWLEAEVNEFPIFKTAQNRKDRWTHFVRLYSEEDIDAQLLRWLQQGHEFIMAR